MIRSSRNPRLSTKYSCMGGTTLFLPCTGSHLPITFATSLVGGEPLQGATRLSGQTVISPYPRARTIGGAVVLERQCLYVPGAGDDVRVVWCVRQDREAVTAGLHGFAGYLEFEGFWQHRRSIPMRLARRPLECPARRRGHGRRYRRRHWPRLRAWCRRRRRIG